MMLEQIEREQDRLIFRNKLIDVMKAIQNELDRYDADNPIKVILMENLLHDSFILSSNDDRFCIELHPSDRIIHGQIMARVCFDGDLDEGNMLEMPIIAFPIMKVDLENVSHWEDLYNAFRSEYTFDVVRHLIHFSERF